MAQKKRRRRLRAMIVASLAVLLIIFGLIADLIGYKQFTDTLTQHYKDYALAAANEAATIINADMLDEFLASGGSGEEFRTQHDRIQTLCDKLDIQFIYAVFVSEDYSDITFVIEAVNSGIPYDEFPVGYTMNINEGENAIYQPRFKDLIENGGDFNIVVNDKGDVSTGHHIAALVPLRSSDGSIKAVLCAQKQMEQLKSARVNYARSIGLVTLILILIAGAGWFIMLRHRLLTPITLISNEARRFAAENTIDPEPVIEKIKYKDELGELAVTIQEMERQTVESFEKMNRISADKQRVDTELKLATGIQAHMLPRVFPPFPERTEFDIYATMDPAREVGGDFYDFFMIGKDKLGIVIADVSGKGIPAALFMAITKILIKNNAQPGTSPAQVFEKTNRMLCDGNENGFFVTAWMGVLDINTGHLTFCNAGHNPPLLRSGSEDFRFLKAPGLVLGGVDDFEYTCQEIDLHKGDRLFLYTDGVTEATDSNKKLYGDERLKKYADAHGDVSLTEALTGLRADIDAFVGDAEQFDDMTMLLLEYRGNNGDNNA